MELNVEAMLLLGDDHSKFVYDEDDDNPDGVDVSAEVKWANLFQPNLPFSKNSKTD